MINNTKQHRTLEGIVISDKMNNTIVIKTDSLVPHKLYGKMIRKNKKYMADDPMNTCRLGDYVLIEECRPLSKNKRWRLRQIIKKSI